MPPRPSAPACRRSTRRCPRRTARPRRDIPGTRTRGAHRPRDPSDSRSTAGAPRPWRRSCSGPSGRAPAGSLAPPSGPGGYSVSLETTAWSGSSHATNSPTALSAPEADRRHDQLALRRELLVRRSRGSAVAPRAPARDRASSTAAAPNRAKNASPRPKTNRTTERMRFVRDMGERQSYGSPDRAPVANISMRSRYARTDRLHGLCDRLRSRRSSTGALVYWLTLRGGRGEPVDAASTAEAGSSPNRPRTPGGYSYASSYAAPVHDGRTYVPIGVDRRSWQTRTVGVLGLLIAVTLAAAALGVLALPGRLARGEPDQRLRVVDARRHASELGRDVADLADQQIGDQVVVAEPALQVVLPRPPVQRGAGGVVVARR